ncbi:MAG: hypothetical protein ACRDMX_12355 [Solirubrobacteraceae bacterium]
MARYLVERYLPSSAAGSLAEDERRLRDHAGPGARLLLSFYAEDDETCFHLLDCRSTAAVRRAGASAGLRIDRIVGVVSVGDAEAVAP